MRRTAHPGRSDDPVTPSAQVRAVNLHPTLSTPGSQRTTHSWRRVLPFLSLGPLLHHAGASRPLLLHLFPVSQTHTLFAQDTSSLGVESFFWWQ